MLPLELAKEQAEKKANEMCQEVKSAYIAQIEPTFSSIASKSIEKITKISPVDFVTKLKPICLMSFKKQITLLKE